MSMDDITNAAGESACVKDTPIAEIWNMPLRHEIIADMEAGLYHKNCKLCWLEEEGGRRSKRMRDNELYSDVDVSTVLTPLSLDLKLGNLCNIKCRTCNSGSSSSWLKEEYDLLPFSKGSLQDYSSRPGYRDIKLSYDADNDNFWKSLKTLLPGVKSLDIYGGEPMYIKKHWELLEYCVQNGYSHQQTLHYNSNGTIFPEEKIETLNKFKKVNIQFSIDGINDRAEYLRHPAIWNAVTDNVRKYKEQQAQHPDRWQINSCLTISAFNIYYIDETYDFLTNTLGLDVYLNLVHMPPDQVCTLYPDDVKSIVTAKLNRYTPPPGGFYAYSWNEALPGILSFFNSNNTSAYTLADFWRVVKRHDGYRNESFENTFKEVYALLKDHVNA